MLSDIYSLVSELYAEKGEAIKAEEYLQEWKQLDGTHATHTTWYLIPAYIRKAQGEYEKAIQLAKMGLEDSDQRTRWKCLVLLSELYELTGNKELASETRMMMIDEYDDLKYNSLAMQMVDWQQKFDDEHHSKDFYIRMTWMQVLIIALIVVVVLAIGVGMWLHRRKVRRLSFRLDEDARRISELRTNIEMQEKSGAENSQEMARLKEELEGRMERISGTLLIGTQMYSQLQQRQCIAEATAKEQQCLVDYFAAGRSGSASTADSPLRSTSSSSCRMIFVTTTKPSPPPSTSSAPPSAACAQGSKEGRGKIPSSLSSTRWARKPETPAASWA